jgi:hypothetical protein
MHSYTHSIYVAISFKDRKIEVREIDRTDRELYRHTDI